MYDTIFDQIIAKLVVLFFDENINVETIIKKRIKVKSVKLADFH